MAENEDITYGLKTAKIMSAAFIISPFVYIGIVTFAIEYGVAPLWPDEADLTGLISKVLAVAGIVSLPIGYYLPKLMVRRGKRGQSTFGLPGSLLSASIFRFSMFVAIAIYGFMLGLLSARGELFLPFIGVSVIAMLLSFPTRERWEKALRGD